MEGLSVKRVAAAREEARKLRTEARSGRDPDLRRKCEELSFEEAAKRHHVSLSRSLKSDRHATLWQQRSLELYALPRIGERPIQAITSAGVLAILNPIWAKKHDTARRVKQRIAAIFDLAKGAGPYPHKKPVAGLNKALPAVKRKAEHMATMPRRELPAFMAQLAVIQKVRGLDPICVFPSSQRAEEHTARSLSVMAFKPLLGRMGTDNFMVHGSRSTFRDWCSESAHADREVADAALSHPTGNELERAFACSDRFDRRRALIDAWGRFARGQ